MNKKMIAGLVLSFVAGAGIGVAATCGYFKTYYEGVADEEIESTKKALRKRYKPSEEEDDSDIAEDGTYDSSPVKTPSGATQNSFDTFGRQKDAPKFDPHAYTKYTSASRAYNPYAPEAAKPSLEEIARARGYDDGQFPPDYESQFEEDFTGVEERSEPDPEDLDKGQRDGNPNGKLPYIISEEEFAYGDQSYGKVTITYYEKDGVLTDTDGSVMVADRIIGEDALRVIITEDDVVYVRNERLGMDYEVVAEDDWFNEPREDDDD